MPANGETPERRVGLPRVRSGPEFNIIQRPEILHRLQTGLGMRGAHIAPVLNEGVTAVVLLEDLSGRETQAFRPKFIAGFDPGVQPVLDNILAAAALVNPGTAPVIAIGGVNQVASKMRLLLKRVIVSTDNTGTIPTSRLHLGAFKTSATAAFNVFPGPAAAVVDYQIGGGAGAVRGVGGAANGTDGRVVRVNMTPIMAPDQVAGLRSFAHAIVDDHTLLTWDFEDRPIVIDPNFGVMTYSEEFSSVAGATSEYWVNFEWEEEPLT